MAGDEAGIDLAGAQGLGVGQAGEERTVAFQARHDRGIQRADQPIDGLLTCRTMRDHFGDHRIIIQSDSAAGFDTGIDANPGAGAELEG